MTTGRAATRPGSATLALLAIVLITAGWWALALWPMGATEPEWLARTRAACFGSTPGGLPDAGGWILLIGQPFGMIGFLVVVWGSTLREELRRLVAHPGGRLMTGAVTSAVLLGAGAAVQRVRVGTGWGMGVPPPVSGVLTTADIDVSGVRLVDQHGRRVPLGYSLGRAALLTVAFAHCATVCPTIIHDLLAARAEADRLDVPLVVVTLDPWRDTPALLPGIADRWALGPEDKVLSGGVAEVQVVLDQLGIWRSRDPSSGDVQHIASVMVLDSHSHATQRLTGGSWRAGELLASIPPVSSPPRR